NFEGYTFTILSYDTNAGWNLYLDSEGENGELLNDAAFRRNTEVEELLGIALEQVPTGDYESMYSNSVLAGDNTYDLVCFSSPGERSTYITENMAYDWKQIPNLQLDAPWYNQNANETFTFAGKQFFGVSDITFAGQQNASILFNIGMVKDYNLQSPFELVDSGKWTVDAFASYFNNIYTDKNSNGEKDAEDLYGLSCHRNHMGRIIASSNEMEVRCGEDGFVINLYSDRLTTLFEKILAITSDNSVRATTENNDLTLFMNNNAMFITYASDPAKLRDVEFDFGYLPFPKYDEAQENYITEAAGGLMAVPTTAENIERTGAVIEALSAGSDKYITEAFIETYVENKVLRNEDSVRMFRLARDTYTYNISYNFDPAGLLASHKFYSTMIADPTLAHASYYESIKESVETAYADLYKLCTELD
ncbi:MAG: hypothetical protein J6N32_10035, partial [Clostridia bacterium]|nr:hypothetical protein [Clostridia bacterium]